MDGEEKMNRKGQLGTIAMVVGVLFVLFLVGGSFTIYKVSHSQLLIPLAVILFIILMRNMRR